MFSAADPYAPAHHHAYRHGAIPTIGRLAKMRAWALAHPGPEGLSASDLSFGGGIDGIGVTDGPEKVYLVFYGSQWGTQSTNAQGNITFCPVTRTAWRPTCSSCSRALAPAASSGLA
jgi:hypothetical protein